MMPLPITIQALVASASAAALLQVAAPLTPDISFVSSIERLGIIGLLTLAVVVLWRKLERKDLDELQRQTILIQALTSNTEAVRSLKETVESLKESVDTLANVRISLAETKARL